MSRWPKPGERVFSGQREANQEFPSGEIVFVDKDWSDIDQSRAIVKFGGTLNGILREGGRYLLEYNGSPIWSAYGAGFMEGTWTYVYHGDYSEYPGGDIKEFWFSDFEGNWESNQGGRGVWVID